jgi:hypothetical protein
MSSRFLLVWFSLLSAAALLSRGQLRAAGESRCSLDGVAIEAGNQVELFFGEQRSADFCSVACALAWPAAESPISPARFVVHEALHGTALDPAAAIFVRSAGGSTASGRELRAFADPLSAAEHARAFGGVIVPNPFSRTHP